MTFVEGKKFYYWPWHEPKIVYWADELLISCALIYNVTHTTYLKSDCLKYIRYNISWVILCNENTIYIKYISTKCIIIDNCIIIIVVVVMVVVW